MGLAEFISKMILGRDRASALHGAQGSDACSPTMVRPCPQEERQEPPVCRPHRIPYAYLTYGPNAVLVREHLLIGRHRSLSRETPVADYTRQAINDAVECYQPSDQRPTVRFLARHQVVVPGTLPENELKCISRHHALILYTPHYTSELLVQRNTPLHILDPGSRTGVYVNGVRIPPVNGGLETLPDDPRTIEDALKCATPLYDLNHITFLDPNYLPTFGLTVVISPEQLEQIITSRQVGDNSFSFL